MGVEEIRSSIGADSLAFVSLEGLTARAASGRAAVPACFDGSYPIPVRSRSATSPASTCSRGSGQVRRAARSQLTGHTAEHDHVASGPGRRAQRPGPSVDRMDAVLGEELADAPDVDALVRP
jgi:hypothetical protein